MLATYFRFNILQVSKSGTSPVMSSLDNWLYPHLIVWPFHDDNRKLGSKAFFTPMWYQSSAHLLHVLTVVVLPSSLLYQLIGPANLKRDNSPGIYSWSSKGIKKYWQITFGWMTHLTIPFTSTILII